MENTLKSTLLSAAFILAVGGAGGLIASTLLASRAYQARAELTKQAEQSLSVTGSARKRIRSDLAVWNIRVMGSGKNLKGAFQDLKPAVERVTTFLDKRGFKADEIVLGAIDTQTHYTQNEKGNDTPEIAGYTLSRTFTVTTSRVEAIAAPAADVTELVQDGLSVASLAPEYLYTKLGELKIEMIGEATKDARSRADQIAVNAGSSLADIHSARMGVLQITRPNSSEVSSSGMNDTSSIEKDVTAVVSLTIGVR